MGKTKLHLGCGYDKKKGYINCDISKDVGPDKVIDLEKKLPFKTDSIDEILANHVFEHIHNFIPLMHELWRICKKNAEIKIRVPFYSSVEQASDPTHVRVFSPYTFDYFDNSSKISKFSHEVKSGNSMFKVENVRINFGVGRIKMLNWLFNPLINLNQRIYCKLFAGIFPASEIIFELRTLK